MNKYTFYEMRLCVNIYSTKSVRGQVHILLNASTSNIHFTKCAYSKYTFYGIHLRANTYSTELAYGQIYIARS